MEMGTPWRVWLTLLLFYKAGSGRAEAGAMELSRIVGESVTFPLEIPAAEQFENAGWTVNTKSLVTVAAGKPPSVVLIDKNNYSGRVRILDESYSLQLAPLRMEDTGQYRVDLNTDKGSVTKRFTLRVYKKVPEPAITCDSVTCVNKTCNYNLSCTVWDGGDNVTYSWNYTTGDTIVPNESVLHISLSPHDVPLNVTCTAQNPVSNSTTTASAKGLCAANPPESQSAHMTRIVVPIVTGIFIVSLIMAPVGYTYWQRRKRALQKYTPGPAGGEEADAEKNTVYAQVGSLPLPSSITGTQKGRLETKGDEMKTIYATVQSPNQSPPQTDDEKLGKDGLESTEKGEKTIYATVNQPTQTKTTKSTDADDSAATSIPQRATEYDKII